jgi:hypothetical protein
MTPSSNHTTSTSLSWKSNMGPWMGYHTQIINDNDTAIPQFPSPRLRSALAGPDPVEPLSMKVQRRPVLKIQTTKDPGFPSKRERMGAATIIPKQPAKSASTSKKKPGKSLL